MAETNKDCPFCASVVKADSLYDVTRRLSRDVIIKPTLGMLIPGYMLAITPECRNCYAGLGEERLRVVDACLSQYEADLAKKFGPYFRIEHGSDGVMSGGSIKHAHIHLVPADTDVGEHIRAQLDWRQMSRFEDLKDFSGRAYIYLGRGDSHFALADPGLPGQWVRRQIAEVKGLEAWDWALVNSGRELLTTFLRLGQLPPGLGLLSSDGTLEYGPKWCHGPAAYRLEW